MVKNDIKKVLKRKVTKDKLTNLPDRATLESRLVSTFNECILDFEVSSPNTHPYSVILFDVDYFKAINDLFGYSQGDNVLRGIGYLLNTYSKSKTKFIGVLGRWGGEEFLIALPYTPTPETKYIADEIRELVVKHSFLMEGTEVPLREQITISLGVSTVDITCFLKSLNEKGVDIYSQSEIKLRELISEANCALEYAKFIGRNRVETFSEYLKSELSNLNIVRRFYFEYSHRSTHELNHIFNDTFLQNNKAITTRIKYHFGFIRREINERDTRTMAVIADNLYKSLLDEHSKKDDFISFAKKYLQY